MIKILSLLFLNLTITAFSFCCSGQKNSDIRIYNRFVNRAEIAIIDSNYQNARCLYDSAFKELSKPFARDLYNAAVCDAIMLKYKDCYNKIIILLNKGLDFQYIKNNQAFKNFMRSRTAKKLNPILLYPGYNVYVRNLYDSINVTDQYFRKIFPTKYMDKYGDTICKIDALNVKFMNELIEKYGWPDEDLIGISDLNSQPFDMIVIHQGNGAQCRIYDYTEDIRNAYENSQIEVHRAAYLIMRSSLSDDFGLMKSGLVTIVFDSIGNFTKDKIDSFEHKSGFYPISIISKKIIDKNRNEFGLESIDELQRKLLFMQSDKRFNISSFGSNSIFALESRSDYENQINLLLPLNDTDNFKSN